MIKVLTISGMTCGHCQARVTRALEAVSGVRNAEVDLASGEARVETDDGVEIDLLIRAVDEAGYRAFAAATEDDRL